MEENKNNEIKKTEEDFDLKWYEKVFNWGSDHKTAVGAIIGSTLTILGGLLLQAVIGGSDDDIVAPVVEDSSDDGFVEYQEF